MNRTFRHLIAGTAVVFGLTVATLADEPAARGEPAVRGERGGAGDRTRKIAGEITKIDNGSVTITVRNRAAERSVDLKLDENVQVTVESNEKVRVMGEGGTVQERAKAVAGKVADLKVGQRVVATTTFGGVATEISASSAPQGEGERRGDAPRDAERPRGEGARDGERPRGEGARDGEKPRVEGARDGERPRGEAPRDGEKPRANVVRDGERPRGDAPRDGERPRGDAPRDGERPREGEPRAAREGERRPGTDSVSGDIATISDDGISVKNGKSAQPPAIPISANVQITIEGEPAKVSDLRPGMPVNVTMREGKAARIEVPIDLSKPKK